MATRHFDNASLGAIPESLLPFSLLMKGYTTPLRLIGPQQAARSRRREERAESPAVAAAAAEAGNIGRGIRWAFALEGGAALLIGAIWALCRLL